MIRKLLKKHSAKKNPVYNDKLITKMISLFLEVSRAVQTLD